MSKKLYFNWREYCEQYWGEHFGEIQPPPPSSDTPLKHCVCNIRITIIIIIVIIIALKAPQGHPQTLIFNLSLPSHGIGIILNVIFIVTTSLGAKPKSGKKRGSSSPSHRSDGRVEQTLPRLFSSWSSWSWSWRWWFQDGPKTNDNDKIMIAMVMTTMMTMMILGWLSDRLLWLSDQDHAHHEQPVDDDDNDDLKKTYLENKDANALKRVEDGEGIGKKQTGGNKMRIADIFNSRTGITSKNVLGRGFIIWYRGISEVESQI